ncbi:DUF4097 family beta strand repeat-containing protein [uncultured Draconibacterium sp.]|uniref:DUF4097 family beta strand repeat-containing protein n=1 Tax=uncultured Draconibacterium sp. TaxID=1573823 RepID=UPI0025DA6544|nr:DUF4097 family beta strand repeat-containing protein [uncultured Draconibacterium sp.]
MRRIKWKIVTVLIVIMVPFCVSAQFTDTREITKTYRITPETQIEISNKYGKIDIKNWDKDSVRFRISIRVEEKKLSKLEESIDGIDFDITNSEHYLIVRTAVEKNRSTLGREIKKFKETLLSSDGNVQVDYTVWMPDSNRLKVDNKFGDIYIGDYKGEADITLSNGNLKAHNFINTLNLTLNFADASVNSISKGRLDCNFSELFVRNMGTVRIQSKSTEFELQKVENLSANSRRDKFRIRQIELLDARSSFTSFRINELADRIKIQAEYGDIELEKTAADFSNVNIESKSTDINLYFSRESAFSYNLKNTKAEVDLGPDFIIVKEEMLDEKEKEMLITGYFGKQAESPEKLRINANSGNINIRAAY